MPFLFWWNTWFGRHLPDQQLTEYLHDEKNRAIFSMLWYKLASVCSHRRERDEWYPD